MSWFSRCSWCGGPFNSRNYRHCTNVSFEDEPVYDSNPNSYNQTPDFSNPLPQHNYKTHSRSDTGLAFQVEFAKLQQNFERFMAQQSCSYCGGPFNGGNYPSCSIVGAGNEFVHDPNPFPYDNTHDLYDHHHSTTCRDIIVASYVGTILTMVMIVHQGSRLSMSRNRATIKTLRKNSYALQAVCEKSSQQEQVATVSTHTPEPSRRFNFFYDDDEDDDDDNDDEESTIPLNEVISQIPPSIAITPSSVKDLVPVPSESKDAFDNDSECDLPFCDNPVTFSNPLFDANEDFTSCDDESLPEEDVPEENFKIYSIPLFEFDEEYISSDVNPLFNEVLEDIENKDSYVLTLDNLSLLVTLICKLEVISSLLVF
ncbi:hypothetical protein Tco_1164276 [Tanacetum coccineum]